MIYDSGRSSILVWSGGPMITKAFRHKLYPGIEPVLAMSNKSKWWSSKGCAKGDRAMQTQRQNLKRLQKRAQRSQKPPMGRPLKVTQMQKNCPHLQGHAPPPDILMKSMSRGACPCKSRRFFCIGVASSGDNEEDHRQATRSTDCSTKGVEGYPR